MRAALAAVLLSSLGAWAFGCAGAEPPREPDAVAIAGPGPGEAADKGPLYAKERLVFQSFDGDELPRNGDGGFPSHVAYNPARKEGGKATFSIEKTDAVAGKSLRISVIEGSLYIQFNPYNYANNPGYPRGPRAFARQYAQQAGAWKFDTYNRVRLWIKAPTNAPPHRTNGSQNADVGTFVKSVAKADANSDETGGGHYYHLINLPALGEWTQVVLNAHPDHARGNSGSVDPGFLPHPTKEDKYNYFDTLTRFYISYPNEAPKSYPADFLLDEIEFFREPRPENNAGISAVTATYRPSDNRLVLTWNRGKGDPGKHEVRYAFADIHKSGWKAAKEAPNGIVTPPGEVGYNNMVYDTTELPVGTERYLFVAIKPQASEQFTQIVVPIRMK
jgi:hypothetical protein